MIGSVLVTVAFWRVLLERLGRQAGQTSVPILLAVVAAGGSVDLPNVALALSGQLAVVLGKAAFQYLTDLHATPGSALGWQLLDRAVPAFAGVFVGVWPIAGQGFATFQLVPDLTAASTAALIAVITYFTNPPAFTHAAAHRLVA